MATVSGYVYKGLRASDSLLQLSTLPRCRRVLPYGGIRNGENSWDQLIQEGLLRVEHPQQLLS